MSTLHEAAKAAIDAYEFVGPIDEEMKELRRVLALAPVDAAQPAKGKCKTDCGSDYCLVQCQNEAAAQPDSSSAPTVFFPCVDDKDNARLTERSAFYLAYPHGFENRYYEDMLWECWCKALEASSSAPAVGGVLAYLVTNLPSGEPGLCFEDERGDYGDEFYTPVFTPLGALAAPAGAAGQDAARLVGWELLDQAAHMCECYADWIKRNVMSANIDEHPYLPELEGVAEDLRAALAAQGDGGTTA